MAVLLFGCARCQNASEGEYRAEREGVRDMCSNKVSPHLVIPEEEEDACVSVDTTQNVTYTCNSDVFPIRWRVSTRQIFDPDEFAIDGIFVTSSNTSGGGYLSSIVITGEGIRFLFDVLEGMPFPVVCLEVRDQVNIVDADMRRVLIYSKSHSHCTHTHTTTTTTTTNTHAHT